MPKTNVSALHLFIFLVSILIASGALGDQPTSTHSAYGPLLSLQGYLGQVADQNQGYKAAALSAKGNHLSAGRGDLLLEPSLTGSAAASATGKVDPFHADDRYNSRIYSLGVADTTSFGLSGKLTYNRSELNVPGFLSDYTAGWTQLDLTQSIWRNWGGNEIVSQSQILKEGDQAQAFNQSYLSKTVMQMAEVSYWQLALARELVKIQRDAVDRAQRLADWEARRTRLQLVDRADYLSASSSLDARRLDLHNAQDDETTASQAFNRARGLNSDVVSESLTEIPLDLTTSMKPPPRMETRDDVKAAEKQAQASAASAALSKEQNKPTVELFGSVPLNEPAPPSGQAAALFAAQEPGTTIGIRFSAPLDIGTTSKVREGYASQAASAEQNYQRKIFEEQRDWSELTMKFAQAQSRLKLYLDLEKAQREKLFYEREREQKGRSTLEQVLLYEADYENAQLGRIRTLADLLNYNAQMKLYGASYESR